MPRYIDADKLLRDTIYNPSHVPYITESDIIFAPAADVVEVVRCKDCIHCDCIIDGMGFFYCDFDEGRPVSPNGFCNVAERRKETDAET